MGRRIRGVLGGLLLAGLILPGTVAAQTIESAYRFLDFRQSASVFGGRIVTNPGSLDLGPKSGTIFGVRYDFDTAGPFVLEAEFGWITATRAVQDTVPEDTTRMTVGEADFGAITGSVALRFNITGPRTWHGLLPYLLFGLGFTKDLASEAAVEKDLPADVRYDFGSRFTATIAGGVEWLATSRVGLRFDVRNMLWKVKTPGPFLFGDRALSLPSSEWTQNVALTAGVTVRF
jgi:hypothetical protein